MSKMWNTPDGIAEPLYVVTPVFNPIRFKNRWKRYQRFQKHILDVGGTLYTIEAAFGEREFAIDEVAPHKEPTNAKVIAHTIAGDSNGIEGQLCRHDDPLRGLHRYVRVRTKTEMWLKENLINVAVQRLPQDWKYVAWIDADIEFMRPNIMAETIHQLQHYDFVQMFSHAQDLGPDYQVMNTRESFMWNYLQGGPLPTGRGYGSGPEGPKWKGAWSGLAWACTRRAWDKVGGLIDFAIHGGGDWHMAFALVGKADLSVRRDLHPSYTARLLEWEALCEKHIRRNVGCVTGTVVHNWHGSKKNRRYADRHQLLALAQFNPAKDLKYDSQGLLTLVDDGSDRYLLLRDGLRAYARERNEDGIDNV
jgi:hypothetical protein